MTSQQVLDQIFAAERELRERERELLKSSEAELILALRRAVDEALKLSDAFEARLRLERLADLCAQVEGPEMVAALIAILGCEQSSVRVAAGEALLDVAYDRYAEVARVIEDRLSSADNDEDSAVAMSELPWILAEVAEPSALPLIRRFLSHREADVTAAAIEALVHLGDSAAIDAMAPFVEDTRQVLLDDDVAEQTVTIGDLAAQAIEELDSGALSQ